MRLFAGVDLWHYVSANLFRRDEERSEFASLACGVAAWQVIIAPATVMLYAIYWSMPQMFSEIHPGFDCWRIAMAISIWHGFGRA